MTSGQGSLSKDSPGERNLLRGFSAIGYAPNVAIRAVLPGVCVLALAILVATSASSHGLDPLIARGKYLVAFGACNDCHTPGWRASDGAVPVARWMVGTNVGIRQDWGTSYPANVRIYFSQISEAQWLAEVRTRGGQMQWHDLRYLNTNDRRAIYRFIRSLGPKGVPSHDEVPPDINPPTPYVDIRLHTPAPLRR